MNAPRPPSSGTRVGLILAIVLPLAVLLLAGVVMAVLSMFKSSDAYTLALTRARADPCVAQALGEPIEEGWFPTGHINVHSGGTGWADLDIPLNGARAAGRLRVKAQRNDEVWKLTVLTLVPDAGERIDLLATSGNDAAAEH